VNKAMKICEKLLTWIAHLQLLTASLYSVHFN